MININRQAKFSVIRFSDFDKDSNAHNSQRLIGSYETYNEAAFIARKALKMEKASIMLSKIAQDPSLEGSIKIDNIFLSDVSYRVVDAVTDTVSTNYHNGVSTIIHHLNEDSHFTKKVSNAEYTGPLDCSFKRFVQLRERHPQLQKQRFDKWTQQLIDEL